MARKPSKKLRSTKPTNSRTAGRGRPSDFRPEFCDQAERLCRLLKATDEQLADFFGKNVATVYRWKQRHPEFREAIKRGGLHADIEISEGLFRKGRGAEWDEEVPIKIKDITYEDGKKVREVERIEIVKVHKVLPPDTMACMYWLNNRQNANWRQRQEVTGKDGGPLDVNLNEVRGGIASKLDRIAAALEKTGVPR